jgi:hypothetical protein
LPAYSPRQRASSGKRTGALPLLAFGPMNRFWDLRWPILSRSARQSPAYRLNPDL